MRHDQTLMQRTLDFGLQAACGTHNKIAVTSLGDMDVEGGKILFNLVKLKRSLQIHFVTATVGQVIFLTPFQGINRYGANHYFAYTL